MRKRIAIIINNADFIFEKNVGARFGGGAIVAQNVYKTFLYEFGFLVHIYARSFSNKYANDSLFKISTSLKNLILDIDSKKYDLVLTFSLDGVYKNQFLQVMSKFNSLEYSNCLVRPILRMIHKKKLEHQSRVYSNLPNFASFIAVSNLVKKDYVNNFKIPQDKIRVIYPCCTINEGELNLRKHSEIVRFGVVANSSINKGGHLFLLAAGIAKLFGAKFEISMIATRYHKDPLLQLLMHVFRLNSCSTIYPKQDDMTDFYDNIDSIVLPSRNEAFGLVALEGMAKGKVPIVSDTAGVAEIIEDGCGFVFRRNSICSFVKSIIEISKLYCFDFEKYKILSEGAYNIAQKYSWRYFCERLLDE